MVTGSRTAGLHKMVIKNCIDQFLSYDLLSGYILDRALLYI